MTAPRPLALPSALLAVLAAALPARAQSYRDGPPPPHRIVYRSLNVFRWNPIGLQSDNRIAYRLRPIESEKVALRDNFVSVGPVTVVNWAIARTLAPNHN